jgi:hypothetical protein
VLDTDGLKSNSNVGLFIFYNNIFLLENDIVTHILMDSIVNIMC